MAHLGNFEEKAKNWPDMIARRARCSYIKRNEDHLPIRYLRFTATVVDEK